jgi:CubicO group peptidase (beta-lactamase class C family)
MPVRAIAAAALVCACSSRASRHGDQHLAPPALADGLKVAAPSEVGLRQTTLAALVAKATADQHKDLESILVARNGRLVLEEYFNGANRDTLRDVRSVAKTITGTLVGIALHEKAIESLDTPVLSFFPAHRDGPAVSKKGSMTVRHLLEMRSGLDADDWWEDARSPGTESRMEAASDRVLFAMQVPMAAAPGERWWYSSVNTLLLGRIVSVATDQDLEEYAKRKLFAPLGFGRHQWRRDPQGNVIPQGNLSIRARDLLKFGLLFQQRGVWRDRRLVPEAWIDEATRSRSVLSPDPPTGLGDLYKGYGYQWWTGEARSASSTHGFYFASGNGGQRVFVVPSLDLVVVVTNSAYNRSYAHRRAHDILGGVLAAASPTR